VNVYICKRENKKRNGIRYIPGGIIKDEHKINIREA
jgi:hypothetical protein